MSTYNNFNEIPGLLEQCPGLLSAGEHSWNGSHGSRCGGKHSKCHSVQYSYNNAPYLNNNRGCRAAWGWVQHCMQREILFRHFLVQVSKEQKALDIYLLNIIMGGHLSLLCKYLLPGPKFYRIYLQKNVLCCPGLFVALYTINAELLTFTWFHPSWEPATHSTAWPHYQDVWDSQM
jgi:hypothetical protein